MVDDGHARLLGHGAEPEGTALVAISCARAGELRHVLGPSSRPRSARRGGRDQGLAKAVVAEERVADIPFMRPPTRGTATGWKAVDMPETVQDVAPCRVSSRATQDVAVPRASRAVAPSGGRDRVDLRPRLHHRTRPAASERRATIRFSSTSCFSHLPMPLALVPAPNLGSARRRWVHQARTRRGPVLADGQRGWRPCCRSMWAQVWKSRTECSSRFPRCGNRHN